MQLPLLTVAAAARPFPAPPQRKPLPAAGDADARGTPAAGGEAATHSTKAREQRQRMPPAAPARSSSSATSRPRGSSTIPAGRPTPRHPPAAAAAAFRRNCRQRWARPEPARLRPRGRPEPRRAEPSRAGREGGGGGGRVSAAETGVQLSAPRSACRRARLPGCGAAGLLRAAGGGACVNAAAVTGALVLPVPPGEEELHPGGVQSGERSVGGRDTATKICNERHCGGDLSGKQERKARAQRSEPWLEQK